MPLATAVPYNYAGMRDAAYTYALVHAASDPPKVYFGYTTDVRKAYNLWWHRLNNPHGKPGVPHPMRAFTWTPDEWTFKLGKGYPSEAHAREAFITARVAGAGGGRMLVLNSTVYTMSRAIARPPRNRAGKLIVRPAQFAYEVQHMPWPTFLDWLMTHHDNRCGNPTDAQVRQAWHIWHSLHGTTPTDPVPDPERTARRARHETNRLAVARSRAKKKAQQKYHPSVPPAGYTRWNSIEGKWEK